MPLENKKNEPTYLGDSVYIQQNEYWCEIFTQNGVQRENVIFLEPAVVVELVRFFEKLLDGE